MLSETMKRVYLDAQKGCGLKVGDAVIIEQKVRDYKCGWGNVWPTKYDFVGKTGIITNLGRNGVAVHIDGIKHDYSFPYFVLRKVAQDDYIIGHALCGLKNGDSVKIVRNARGGERGWHYSWPYDYPIVGQEGVIVEDAGNKGFLIRFPIDCFPDLYLPYFVLTKVEAEQCSFKPFDKVLVRDSTQAVWQCDLFSHYKEDEQFPYATIYSSYKMCIPFEGNEGLVSTAKEPYK